MTDYERSYAQNYGFANSPPDLLGLTFVKESVPENYYVKTASHLPHFSPI
jgi:hypothetical protein